MSADALRLAREALRAVIESTHSHIDGRDLLAELHPRKTLDIKRRRDARETWFEGDWLSDVWAAVKQARAAIAALDALPAQAEPAEPESLRKDAERYRWLRAQHWNNADLCVVANPKVAVRLGHDCPSLERLDFAIDAAMAAEPQEQK